MALAIVLSVNQRAPKWREDTSISFEGGDADYWYLWPTLIKEIKNQTGELIDLYDDAEFSGENLRKLANLIQKHLRELSQKKEAQWDVRTGTQLAPVKKELFKLLVKKELEG